MRSMDITDEWLYQHMPVVDNAMITALENQVDREYVFSKRFEQKMQKVIRREAHPVLTGMWRTGSDVKCGCLSG